MHQQIIDQNLIIQNQQKKIENFLKKTFESFNVFQFIQFKKMSFDEFLINHQSFEKFQFEIENFINLLRKFKKTFKSQLFD